MKNSFTLFCLSLYHDVAYHLFLILFARFSNDTVGWSHAVTDKSFLLITSLVRAVLQEISLSFPLFMSILTFCFDIFLTDSGHLAPPVPLPLGRVGHGELLLPIGVIFFTQVSIQSWRKSKRKERFVSKLHTCLKGITVFAIKLNNKKKVTRDCVSTFWT